MKKNWLFRVYRGLYYYKDPYSTTTIMESKSCCVFFLWFTCLFGRISFPKFDSNGFGSTFLNLYSYCWFSLLNRVTPCWCRSSVSHCITHQAETFHVRMLGSRHAGKGRCANHLPKSWRSTQGQEMNMWCRCCQELKQRITEWKDTTITRWWFQIFFTSRHLLAHSPSEACAPFE